MAARPPGARSGRLLRRLLDRRGARAGQAGCRGRQALEDFEGLGQVRHVGQDAKRPADRSRLYAPLVCRRLSSRRRGSGVRAAWSLLRPLAPI